MRAVPASYAKVSPWHPFRVNLISCVFLAKTIKKNFLRQGVRVFWLCHMNRNDPGPDFCFEMQLHPGKPLREAIQQVTSSVSWRYRHEKDSFKEKGAGQNDG
jgi:hypothetical protein